MKRKPIPQSSAAALMRVARQGPEWAQAVAELVSILEGKPAPGPRDPLTGEPWELPLTNEQCAAINHAQLAKLEVGRERLAKMPCRCDFCLHWRAENGIAEKRRILPRR
jgi:hypothetical protein